MLRKPLSFLGSGELQDLVAGQHQLAYQVHHLVQQSNVHPNSVAGQVMVLDLRLQRIGDSRRRGGAVGHQNLSQRSRVALLL